MLNIDKNIAGGEAVFTLGGRLDATTAPQFDDLTMLCLKYRGVPGAGQEEGVI